MSSGDYLEGSDRDKYEQSIPRWNGPERNHETLTWEHDVGTVVEVSASAGDATHRDTLVWSVIVRPDGRSSPGRRITQHYLDSRKGAVERAEQFCDDYPDGELPQSSYDEWGVEQ